MRAIYGYRQDQHQSPQPPPEHPVRRASSITKYHHFQAAASKGELLSVQTGQTDSHPRTFKKRPNTMNLMSLIKTRCYLLHF